jgi:hypothetical protein
MSRTKSIFTTNIKYRLTFKEGIRILVNNVRSDVYYSYLKPVLLSRLANESMRLSSFI